MKTENRLFLIKYGMIFMFHRLCCIFNEATTFNEIAIGRHHQHCSIYRDIEDINRIMLMLQEDIDLDEVDMNHSDDIIEAFAFKRGASCRHTARLKEQYAEISTGIEKKDDSDRNNNWTKSTQDELWENFEKWKQYPDKMDEKFLLWLGSKASGLDIPSHTAIRIYRNLAIYAYTRIIGLHDLPSEEIGFLDDFEYLCDNNKDNRDITYYLYQDGTVSQKNARKSLTVFIMKIKNIQNSTLKTEQNLGASSPLKKMANSHPPME